MAGSDKSNPSQARPMLAPPVPQNEARARNLGNVQPAAWSLPGGIVAQQPGGPNPEMGDAFNLDRRAADQLPVTASWKLHDSGAAASCRAKTGHSTQKLGAADPRQAQGVNPRNDSGKDISEVVWHLIKPSVDRYLEARRREKSTASSPAKKVENARSYGNSISSTQDPTFNQTESEETWASIFEETKKCYRKFHLYSGGGQLIRFDALCDKICQKIVERENTISEPQAVAVGLCKSGAV